MVVASHDTVVKPNFNGRVQLDMGPSLPDVRSTSGGWIGVDIVVGKTTANTAQELAVRYAAIGAHPNAEQKRVREQIGDLALEAALRSAVLALVPIGLWVLLGPTRRAELFRRRGALPFAAGSTGLALVVLL